MSTEQKYSGRGEPHFQFDEPQSAELFDGVPSVKGRIDPFFHTKE